MVFNITKERICNKLKLTPSEAILAIIISYIKLVALCAIGFLVIIFLMIPEKLKFLEYLASMEKGSLILFTSKIVKLFSYAFILFGVLIWMFCKQERDDKGVEDPHHLASFIWAFSVSITTLIVMLIIFSSINVEMTGGTTNPYKFNYIIDNIITMLPLVLMFSANFHLMKKGTTNGLSPYFIEVYKSHRRFFYIIYVPVVTAAITMISMALILNLLIDDHKLLAVMLSGAMGFLVFITHCTERIVHQVGNLRLI